MKTLQDRLSGGAISEVRNLALVLGSGTISEPALVLVLCSDIVSDPSLVLGAGTVSEPVLVLGSAEVMIGAGLAGLIGQWQSVAVEGNQGLKT